MAEDLRQVARAVAPLAASIRELCGDDDLAFADTLDGETSAIEAARAAVRTIFAMEAMAEASKGLSQRYAARSKDFADRAARGRQALVQFLAELGEKSLVLPEGTISDRAGGQSVTGQMDVSALPIDCIRIKREPDMAAIKAALMAGRTVPGASLTNAPPSLQIRGGKADAA